MNYVLCSFSQKIVLVRRRMIFWCHDAFLFLQANPEKNLFPCNYFPTFIQKNQEILSSYMLFHRGLLKLLSKSVQLLEAQSTLFIKKQKNCKILKYINRPL